MCWFWRYPFDFVIQSGRSRNSRRLRRSWRWLWVTLCCHILSVSVPREITRQRTKKVPENVEKERRLTFVNNLSLAIKSQGKLPLTCHVTSSPICHPRTTAGCSNRLCHFFLKRKINSTVGIILRRNGGSRAKGWCTPHESETKQSAERKLNDPPSVKPLLPHFPIVTSGQESIKWRALPSRLSECPLAAEEVDELRPGRSTAPPIGPLHLSVVH